ncbi:DUF2474 domain-containing protein [Pseudomonas silvicola]|nr:DUF2474 domain-containing protein [Pseudomonas silvicola]
MDDKTTASLWSRMAWLVVIYTASVGVLFLVAMALRMLMSAGGMRVN